MEERWDMVSNELVDWTSEGKEFLKIFIIM